MVNVEFYRKKDTGYITAGGIDGDAEQMLGKITKIIVNGHTGYAKAGTDIVCAAASATIYTAAGAMSLMCGLPKKNIKERDGYFKLMVPEFKNEGANMIAEIILETAFIGFKQIEGSYGDFLKVTEIID